VKSLSHTNQPESVSCAGGVLNEAHPIVRDTEVEEIGGPIELNIDLCGVAMFGDIVMPPA
jgi:hypothetical protein